jgi:hypothetical protein
MFGVSVWKEVEVGSCPEELVLLRKRRCGDSRPRLSVERSSTLFLLRDLAYFLLVRRIENCRPTLLPSAAVTDRKKFRAIRS